MWNWTNIRPPGENSAHVYSIKRTNALFQFIPSVNGGSFFNEMGPNMNSPLSPTERPTEPPFNILRYLFSIGNGGTELGCFPVEIRLI